MRKAWQRNGPDTRVRGRAGQKARERRLARTHGLCEHCLRDDVTRLAVTVNHIVPLARGGPDTDENTENLCAAHDAIVTAQQFGKAQPVKGKGIGRDGRPTSGDHPWNRRAYVGSTVARRIDAGQWRAACDAMLMWDKAGGKRVQGLANRRAAERALCLQNLPA